MARPLSPERRRSVVEGLAAGLGPMEVSRRTGVSKSLIYRIYHSVGGMYRPVGTEYCDRYLSRDERYEIARLTEAGWSMRRIAAQLGRSPSTISRELHRNLSPRSGTYVPEVAHSRAWQRQRRPKPRRLAEHLRLRLACQEGLNRRWSPEQIAGRLIVEHPDDESMRISHEAIYQAIYVRPVGELKPLLTGQLRQGRVLRKRRGRQETRGRIPGMVSIAQRPEEVEGRQVPGHHEGDLILGSLTSRSAIATIVERTSGYLTLAALPQGRGAVAVADAVSTVMADYPPCFRRSLTWDQGREMARHAVVSQRAGLDVYFADPHSPWQRGSNENVNGLLREYFPKGADLSALTQPDVEAVAQELNDRPRKRLGFRTPAEVFADIVKQDTVATTN